MQSIEYKRNYLFSANSSKHFLDIESRFTKDSLLLQTNPNRMILEKGEKKVTAIENLLYAGIR